VKELIRIAVQQRKVVLFISFVAVIFGMYSYYTVPKQENPHIKVTGAIIKTVYPGASPEDMKKLVTKKIEDAVSGISEYEYVSSESGKNVSVVVVMYHNDADIDRANRELREKIDEVKGDLPNGCREPEINTDPAEAAGMLISLSGGNYTYEQLSSYAEEIKTEEELDLPSFLRRPQFSHRRPSISQTTPLVKKDQPKEAIYEKS